MYKMLSTAGALEIELPEMKTSDDKVVVFTKSHCMQCSATQRFLTNNNVSFTTIDLESEEGSVYLDALKGIGVMQAPFVVWDEFAWSGFRPDVMKGLLGA